MQRTVVDLPLPEGPMITSFSPSATVKSTSFRTWRSPNILFTFSSRIMSLIGIHLKKERSDCTAIKAPLLFLYGHIIRFRPAAVKKSNPQ